MTTASTERRPQASASAMESEVAYCRQRVRLMEVELLRTKLLLVKAAGGSIIVHRDDLEEVDQMELVTHTDPMGQSLHLRTRKRNEG